MRGGAPVPLARWAGAWRRLLPRLQWCTTRPLAIGCVGATHTHWVVWPPSLGAATFFLRRQPGRRSLLSLCAFSSWEPGGSSRSSSGGGGSLGQLGAWLRQAGALQAPSPRHAVNTAPGLTHPPWPRPCHQVLAHPSKPTGRVNAVGPRRRHGHTHHHHGLRPPLAGPVRCV